jgi:hypothetical protein
MATKNPTSAEKKLVIPTLKEIRPAVPPPLTPEMIKERDAKAKEEKRIRDLKTKREHDASEIKSLAISTLKNSLKYLAEETARGDAMNPQTQATFEEYKSLAEMLFATGIAHKDIDKS